MDFALDEEQRRVRDRAAEVSRDLLAAAAPAHERDERVPPAVYERLGELGLMGVAIPKRLGGSEAGTVAYSLAMTEIARGCASTAVTMAVTNMVGEVLVAFGTEAQQARYNPALCAGRHGAFALSEVGAGSDPGGMATTARRDGDGWVLDGTKQWISHGDTSEVLVVWARTGGEGSKGLSCFLVDGDAPGLSVESHEDKMGLRASHTCALVLEEVRVPAEALLGAEGGGFPIAMMALDGGRVGIASQALGVGLAAYDQARAHLRAHPSDQADAFRLADIATSLEAARAMTLRAAWLKQHGRPFSREASMAKVWSTEHAFDATSLALEIVGPAALDRRRGIERLGRDVRVTMIYEGTSEVQRIVIGRHVTRG